MITTSNDNLKEILMKLKIKMRMYSSYSNILSELFNKSEEEKRFLKIETLNVQ